MRGINVGGHKPVPMEKLKKALEALHFTNVRTILVSGNVLFQAPRGKTEMLERKIRAQLKKAFGSEIGVHVRTIDELVRARDSDPFKGFTSGPDVRFYVTFLSGKSRRTLTIPYEAPGGRFRIFKKTPREAFSVLTLSPESRTVDLMKVLEQKFGKEVTTRNYNTIIRVLSRA
jgi:uncharacterized protein (DUF1697 family)